MKKYDIFISYRRTSFDTANLIATRLKAAGYSVFFDLESLRSGKFNEQLFEVIDNCRDFIVVLPLNALDRCVNNDDWVRLEVCHAMQGNKNIIPVMLNGFTWPNPMPKGMEELCNYQAISASPIEYFDMAMEKLQRQYLQSKPHIQARKLAKHIALSLGALLAVAAILWGVFMVLSKDVCVKYATAITKDAGAVHFLAEENHRLSKDWEVFNTTLNYASRPDRIKTLQNEMLARIDLVEKDIRQLWYVDSAKLNISSYHSFLLSLHGINAEEISISPQFATLYLNDFLEQLNNYRTAVKEPNSMNRRYVSVLFETFPHLMNSYYASVLAELSNFPESSRTTFNELSPNWIYFPIQLYKIGEKRSYYENITNTETKLCDELLSRFESVLQHSDAELEDIIKRNDLLEQQIVDGFDEIKSQIGSNTQNSINEEREKELALRREKIVAKEAMVNAMKDNLSELDKEYVQTYEALKKKCTIEESDDQWYKWGKIVHWGKFLSTMVESRQKLLAQGIRSTSSITPDIAYADMNSLLTVYQTYHPESRDYIASAKLFFRELSKAERKYAGVIVFAFKDDAEHPFFKKGDIVIGYDGKAIKNYSEFNEAYKNNKSGEVVFLRNIDGHFEEFKEPITETDIVGFLELTE